MGKFISCNQNNCFRDANPSKNRRLCTFSVCFRVALGICCCLLFSTALLSSALHMLRIRKRGECHQDCDCIFFPARVNCLLGNSWNFIRQLAAGTADECRSKFRHIVVGNDISLIVQYNRDGPQFFATRTNVSQCDNYYDCGGYFALINIPATRRLN